MPAGGQRDKGDTGSGSRDGWDASRSGEKVFLPRSRCLFNYEAGINVAGNKPKAIAYHKASPKAIGQCTQSSYQSLRSTSCDPLRFFFVN
ncbi:hypothetical protein CSUB01_10089 [Colletotrichum sublineola]|uniref:Uncharacterized protein n=1 Tax=Colletotrichum sublineola TaxID=1173701 RepID=A0A066XLJ5_COLSU|nr:hypothetical protein CSUB01_10089 [Colletotrichum sublineola]